MSDIPIKRLAVVIIAAAILSVVLGATTSISGPVIPLLAGLTNAALISREKRDIKTALVVGIASVVITYPLVSMIVILMLALGSI